MKLIFKSKSLRSLDGLHQVIDSEIIKELEEKDMPGISLGHLVVYRADQEKKFYGKEQRTVYDADGKHSLVFESCMAAIYAIGQYLDEKATEYERNKALDLLNHIFFCIHAHFQYKGAEYIIDLEEAKAHIYK